MLGESCHDDADGCEQWFDQGKIPGIAGIPQSTQRGKEGIRKGKESKKGTSGWHNKKRGLSTPAQPSIILWLGDRDSNPNSRSQSPLSYR
jgi:hypothetical protein